MNAGVRGCDCSKTIGMRNLPPLNALRAFEATGRAMTFRAAADELGVTQGAVAQHVRALEARLQVPLFERRHRDLAFTDAGRAYHDAIERAFSSIEAATARLQPGGGEVTISVTPSFATCWLIPNMRGLTEAHPDVQLQIMATERVTSFYAEPVDLAVRQGRGPFGASLRAELLFENLQIPVAAPDVAERVREAPETAVLLHEPHGRWPDYFERLFQGTREMAQRGPKFSQTALAIDAAAMGQGVVLAPKVLVARHLAEGRLVQVWPDEYRGERHFYLLARNDIAMRPEVEKLWNWCLLTGGKSAETQG